MLATYEFTTDQNIVLRLLSKRMKAVAIFLIIMGALVILQGVQQMFFGNSIITSIGIGSIYIIMGVWTYKSGKSFEQIVLTEGTDINHLMKANSSLLSLYTLQYWLFIIALIILVISLIMVSI